MPRFATEVCAKYAPRVLTSLLDADKKKTVRGPSFSVGISNHTMSAVPIEDVDLSAAFGPLFRALPRELLAKIVPPERTVMLCRVSKGARQALTAACAFC